ncbi:MAG: 2'-5' RNA ligase family protein [Armatimonadota bacterium]
MSAKLMVAGMLVLVLAGCEDTSTSTNSTVQNDQSPNVEKTIIAIQAFIDPADSDKIMALCTGLKGIKGYDSDLGRSFIPHVTLASWKVTPDELRTAISQYGSRLTGMNRISVPVHLKEKKRDDGRLNYYLMPEVSEALLEFHSTVHEKLDWHYEPFRQIDLPGSWVTHLTLFSIPADQRPRVTEALKQLRKIKSITIERIGFVDCGPALKTIEVKLNNPDETE